MMQNRKKFDKHKQAVQKPHVAEKQQTGFFRNRNIPLILLLVTVIVTFIVYSRAIGYGFIYNWDDAGYILKNEYLQSFTLSNIADIFSSFHMHNYHPLTTLTYLIEYTLVGEKAWLYHLNNILLHLANTYLVYFLIRKLLRGAELPALITAALFALHPMHVESVAWISERKDVLYTFFYLMALIRYVHYLETGKRSEYLYTVLFFILSCFSKSAAVTLPVLLFAFDYLHKRQLRVMLVIEKIPLILVSLIFGILAIKSQDTAIQDLTPLLTFFERLLIVCWGICLYVYKALVPVGLSAFYPYPLKTGDLLPWYYYTAPFLIAALGYFIWYSRKWGREVIFGFAFFFITISLVLQLMPVGGAIIAERYTYVPYIGLFFIFSLPFAKLYGTVSKISRKNILMYLRIFVLLVAVFAVLSYERIGYWKDGDVLFTDVLKKYPRFPYGYNNRGFLYFDYYALKVYPENETRKNAYIEKALQDYTTAITLDPGYAGAYANRAVLLYNTGRPQAALEDFNKLLSLDPVNRDGLLGRANTLSSLEMYAEAIPDYSAYLQMKQDDAKAWLWRGIAYSRTGENELALADLEKSATLNPDDYEVFYWQGIVFSQMNDHAKAIPMFDKSVKLNPENYELYSWRGLAFYELKQYDMAVADYSMAIQLKPEELSTYINRSAAYNELKKYQEAFSDLIYAAERGYPISRGYYESLLAKTK